MATNVPERPAAGQQLFPTIPPQEATLLMTSDELRDRVLLMDVGSTLGPTDIVRWQRAAIEGQWTAEELLAAVDWLNLNQSGYVKIAHVHKRIDDMRRWLKLARTFCYLHDVAALTMTALTGQEWTPDQVERAYDDNRPLWRETYQDAVMQVLQPRTWRAWAEQNVDLFRTKS